MDQASLIDNALKVTFFDNDIENGRRTAVYSTAFPAIEDGEDRWYEKIGDTFASQQFPKDQRVCSAVTSKCWHQKYESAKELVRDIVSLESVG